MLACAFVAASLYVLVFGLGLIEWMGEQPTIRSLFLSYLVLLPFTFVAYVALMPLAFAQLVFPAAAGVALMVLARSVLARLRRS